MKNYIKLIFLSIVICTSIFPQKRAFTIEDLYKVQNVGGPVLSNDETKVAFTVTKYDLQNASSNTDIYVMNLDGSELNQFTTDASIDSNPIWNQDDSGLYFSSYRDGAEQIYYKPVDGGSVEKITDFSQGAGSSKISADEKYFIFASNIFPECGVDQECNSNIGEAIVNGPIQAHLADSLFVRHWTEYNDGQYSHIILYNTENKKYFDLTPGYFHSPAFSAGGSNNYNFSPDSKEIVFDSKRVANPESSTNIDIWTVALDGSRLKNITPENEGADSHPKYSPDGKYIAYLTQTTPTYESDRIRIALHNRQTGKNQIITNEFDNWVIDFEWSADSKTIYFNGYVKGYMPLMKIDIESFEITEVISKKSIKSFDVTVDESLVLFNHSLIHQPTEIAVASVESQESKNITQFNTELSEEVDILPGEQVWIEGADGKKCHVFIVKPHNFDPNKKYPLVINVHGGPQYQWMDSFRGDWQVYPGSGYVLAFPNPHGSTGYGQAYTSAISADWDGKVYEDVMKVTDYLARLPYVDENKMGAMGWSFGGYFMNLLQAKTKRFKCLASMMGIYDLAEFWEETEELWFPAWDLNREDYETMSPSKYSKNFSIPTLIISGERDYRIPYTQSLRYFTILQQKNIDSRLIIFKNDGHWPNHLKSMPLYYNSHLEWFHKYLGGKKAPWDSKDMVRNLYLKN